MGRTDQTNTTIQDGNNQNEVRDFFQHGLMRPNPRQYYQMTRSYESLRQEYNLLNCDKVSDEDLINIMKLMKTKENSSLPLFFVLPITTILCIMVFILTVL